MAEIKNLTPHTVYVMDENGRTLAVFAPAGEVARAVQSTQPVAPLEGVVEGAVQATLPDGSLAEIPMARVSYGAPKGLPAPARDVFLIVSSLTVSAAREAGRPTYDLLTTVDPVRDAEGRVIGCRYLAYN